MSDCLTVWTPPAPTPYQHQNWGGCQFSCYKLVTEWWTPRCTLIPISRIHQVEVKNTCKRHSSWKKIREAVRCSQEEVMIEDFLPQLWVWPFRTGGTTFGKTTHCTNYFCFKPTVPLKRWWQESSKTVSIWWGADVNFKKWFASTKIIFPFNSHRKLWMSLCHLIVSSPFPNSHKHFTPHQMSKGLPTQEFQLHFSSASLTHICHNRHFYFHQYSCLHRQHNAHISLTLYSTCHNSKYIFFTSSLFSSILRL